MKPKQIIPQKLLRDLLDYTPEIGLNYTRHFLGYYDTPEEEKQTRKLINKLNDKLGVL